MARAGCKETFLPAAHGQTLSSHNTVHDSIIIDCDSSHVSTLAKTMLDVFEDVPKNFQKMFGKEFNLPMKAEVQVGNNWKDMEIWKNT